MVLEFADKLKLGDRIFGLKDIYNKEEALNFLINKSNKALNIIGCDNKEFVYDFLNNLNEYEKKNIQIITSEIDKKRIPNNIEKKINLYINKNNFHSFHNFWIIDKTKGLYLFGEKKRKEFNLPYGFISEKDIFLEKRLLFDFHNYLKKSIPYS